MGDVKVKKNIPTIIIICIFGFILLGFHAYSKKQPESKEAENIFNYFDRPYQWVGRYAPDFEIELVTGEKFVLADHIGKEIIVLNFFATWCEPCQEEMAELNAYFGKHKEDPFILLGIDADESAEKVSKFIRDFEVHFPIAIDNNDLVQKSFRVEAFPTTIVIGADGMVKLYEVGPITNADIAFDALFVDATNAIMNGEGITRDVYYDKVRNQKDLPVEESTEEDDRDKLEGRAKAIAENMYCPCGCSDLLIACGCKTAKDIREKLRTDDFSGKTDEDVIRELNREFCVKGSKKRHGQG